MSSIGCSTLFRTPFIWEGAIIMPKKKSVLIFTLSIFILLSGCKNKEQAKTPAPIVKTQEITFSDQANTFTYPGSVRGRYESQLAFQVNGKIIARNVDLGTRVTAGQTLMQIDAKDIVENVRMASAQLESAKSQLELARSDYERYHILYQSGAVSASQDDQFRTRYEAALATLKQANAQYTQSNNALSYTSLASDSDGVVSSIQAEIGQVVAAGQTIVTVVKAGDLEIEITLPESQFANVRIGQPATVTFWALPDVTTNGTIREISPMADPVTRSYTARISLSAPPQEIQLGMTASVNIDTTNSTDRQTTVLPLSAIYQTDNQPQVWLVKDGKVQLQNVTISNFADNQVIVTSGLQQGDIVVIAGVHKLIAGQEVRLATGTEL